MRRRYVANVFHSVTRPSLTAAINCEILCENTSAFLIVSFSVDRECGKPNTFP